MNSGFAGFLTMLLIIAPTVSYCQSEKKIIKKYLNELPRCPVGKSLQKYKMTAVYTNRDLYANFTGKTKVTGNYTRGLDNGFVIWDNICVSGSDSFSDSFQ